MPEDVSRRETGGVDVRRRDVGHMFPVQPLLDPVEEILAAEKNLTG